MLSRVYGDVERADSMRKSPPRAVDRDRRPPAGRPALIAWPAAGILLVGVLILSVRQVRAITDPDVWWHLRLGDEFRSGWSLSNPGSLSPFADQAWVPTQWSLEIVASWLTEHFGVTSVAWLAAVAVVALGAVLWWGNRERAAPAAAAVATAATLAGTMPVLAPRPQVASIVLLAVAASAWWRTSTDLRPRWWLVPLTWVWACTHGFWIVGVAVGAFVAAGLALDRRVDVRRGIVLMSIPLLSVVAAALTPVGPTLLVAPLRVRAVTSFVQEWQPPVFTDPSTAIVGAMAGVVVLAYARKGRVAWADLALLVLAGVLLVYAERTVALAAVLLSGPLATVLDTSTRPSRTESLGRERAVVVAGAFAVVAIVTAVAVVRAPVSIPYSPSIDGALSRLPEGTVVLNAYRDGGWLAWQHRDLVHGIDGLTEAYSPAYIGRYFAAEALRPGWREFVDDEMSADAVLLPPEHPLGHQLRTVLSWPVVAETESHVLLIRPG